MYYYKSKASINRLAKKDDVLASKLEAFTEAPLASLANPIRVANLCESIELCFKNAQKKGHPVSKELYDLAELFYREKIGNSYDMLTDDYPDVKTRRRGER